MQIVDLKTASNHIKQGNIVAFPTETVYGLGADATSDDAIERIYQLKKRPPINPLIIHVADIKTAMSLAEFNDSAIKLSSLWPGPLTLVLPLKSNIITKRALANLNTIAIRIPSHPIARQLLKLSNKPIAAPSANPSGYVSATHHQHVLSNFADCKAYLLPDRELSDYGIESTIVDVTARPLVLRPGIITLEDLSVILEQDVNLSPDLVTHIKAPGQLLKHYSPKTKVYINTNIHCKCDLALDFGDTKLNALCSLNLSPKSDVLEAARNLYTMLIELDDYAIKNNIDEINIAKIPNHGIGIAINNRLRRMIY